MFTHVGHVSHFSQETPLILCVHIRIQNDFKQNLYVQMDTPGYTI